MVSAIVLAAGSSLRMGHSNKLLLPWQGKPLIAHSIEAVLSSSVDEVLTVVGYQSLLVREALREYSLGFVENLYYKTGMMSSIKAGILAAKKKQPGMDDLSRRPTTGFGDLAESNAKPFPPRIQSWGGFDRYAGLWWDYEKPCDLLTKFQRTFTISLW